MKNVKMRSLGILLVMMLVLSMFAGCAPESPENVITTPIINIYKLVFIYYRIGMRLCLSKYPKYNSLCDMQFTTWCKNLKLTRYISQQFVGHT